jgi:lysyl-tRNA synthetase class 2
MSLSELEILRRNALSELRKLGIDPYPAERFDINANAADILANYEANPDTRTSALQEE